ncbi:inactive hydroxysteroid dehydrogenase-like protein 1 [Clytia hemisphaerica]
MNPSSASLDTLNMNYLLNDFIDVIVNSENLLVLIGALYVSKVSLKIIYRVANAIKTYVIPRYSPNSEFAKHYKGRWAVVTGASEGIGRGYAIQLAARNMNVFLISRNVVKLQNVQQEIFRLYGNKVKTICYPLDMTKLSDSSVYDALKSKLDELDVGILVNNVGLFFKRMQFFLTVPRETHDGIINLNMSALTTMTHMVLPGMISSGKGAIINIGSGACAHPTPTMSSYSASKKYVDYLTKTLQYEYAEENITFQCIHPFYVSTNMTNNAKPSFFIPDPVTYANSALSTLGYSNTNYGYWSHGLFGYLGEWLPDCVYNFLAVHINIHLWSWLTGVTIDKKKQ